MGWPLDLSEPINRGLVGYWYMPEGSGNKVFDLSGNGRTGIFAAGAASPSWASGKFGSTLGFDGGDYVSCGFVDIGNLLTYSISVWIKGPSGPFDYFLSLGNSGNNTPYIRFAVWDDDKVVFSHNDDVGTSAGMNGVGPSVNDGAWHNIIVVRYKANLFSLFVDGIWIADSTNSPGVTTLDLTTIGAFRRIGVSNHYIGLIDIPIIYNRVLSASEITLFYRFPFYGFLNPDEIPVLDQYYTVTAGGIMTPNTGYWGAI